MPEDIPMPLNDAAASSPSLSAMSFRDSPDNAFRTPRLIQPGSVLLVTKKGHAEALDLAGKISAWLDQHGMNNTVMENGENLEQCMPVLDTALVLVLGGDGTMISVARRLCGNNIVLLGINFARVGFLTECPRQRWQSVLRTILDHGVCVSSRMLLDVLVRRREQILFSAVAVNDIVAGRGNLARLIHINVAVDGEQVASLRADGLIICTPTGSSGYFYSAGGPLIHPELDVIGLAPICSFLTEIKPLVLPGDRQISIAVAEDTQEAFLTLDGQSGFQLQSGDRIHAVASSRRLLLAAIGQASYFQKLRAKGFILETAERKQP